MLVLKNTLNIFETMSGQRVSLQKSQIHFSKNVDYELAERLTMLAGIQSTTNLGRYLGVPSIHGRVTTNLFTPLMEIINSRLEGWKGKNLTLAGRVILAQSVLSATPYYMMQSMLLPKGVCDEIEKRIRNFVWGKGVYMVKWENVVLPKSKGGLGLRHIHQMNLAFLAKMGRRLINESDSLWARTMKAKYIRSNDYMPDFTWKPGSSNLWRGICKVKDILAEGLRTRNDGKEKIYWSKESSGRFSVSSAYDLAMKTDDMGNDIGWKKIWKLRAPNKICLFLWLVKNKRIMTNGERRRRSFSMDSRCPGCDEQEEDVAHCIRNCTKAMEIWGVFLPRGACKNFFNMDFDSWLFMNISGRMKNHKEGDWSGLFALVVWWIWRWRCNLAFRNESWEKRDKIRWLQEQNKERLRAFARSKAVEVKNMRPKIVTTGHEDWMYLHTDATFTSPNEITGCGGVLRNQRGEWIGGFSCLSRTSSATEGVLATVLIALQWAWDKGVKKIHIFSDSLTAIQWIKSGPEPLGPCGDITRLCKACLVKEWEITLEHTPREFNQVADSLAKIAPRRSCEWIELYTPPEEVRDILSDECIWSFATGRSN
ncbi:PREDICTED: uncharacterized protein LOC109169788 isoform X1 [Ipomoea nil]|uniref:uncharacterized protein LOC109169788 isoform X1 n=1 Tax=Ipomoea nil TaxID=35883 RepID=UPI000900AA7E|nr:PREDICTED: uncharacterized protein LOC109169788 isoform X1 [Ipomoea nil]